MRNQHVWRETTGDKREVRATRFAGRWRLQSKLGRDGAWAYHDAPAMHDLLALRDLIWRKYQRKRASYDDVTSVDALITQRQQSEKAGLVPKVDNAAAPAPPTDHEDLENTAD